MKIAAYFLPLVLLCSACTNQQVAGTVTGSWLGGVFGSSIGRVVGGWHGDNVGTLIGMTVGGIVGNAVTAPKKESSDSYRGVTKGSVGGYSDSHITKDDKARAYFDGIEIEEARFIDDTRNQEINAGEHCKLIFNIFNRSNRTIYNIAPIITVSGTKYIQVSPTAIVGDLEPGKGVRYTACVYGMPKLKSGMADFSIQFVYGKSKVTIRTFQLPTNAKE